MCREIFGVQGQVVRRFNRPQNILSAAFPPAIISSYTIIARAAAVAITIYIAIQYCRD